MITKEQIETDNEIVAAIRVTPIDNFAHQKYQRAALSRWPDYIEEVERLNKVIDDMACAVPELQVVPLTITEQLMDARKRNGELVIALKGMINVLPDYRNEVNAMRLAQEAVVRATIPNPETTARDL